MIGCAARNACLEQHLNAVLLRVREDFRAVLCHHLFVSGYDMLSERDALEDVVERGLLAADDLYDDVHIWIVQDVIGVGRERAIGQVCGTLPAEVSHKRALQRSAARQCQLRQQRGFVT